MLVSNSWSVFRGSSTETATMLNALARMYDPFSSEQLDKAGIANDASCLVLGAGASKIPARLADMAPAGRIVATDVTLRHAVPDPRVHWREHDLSIGDVPDGPWDVIHARLLLDHLPSRDHILRALAGALAPDGILVIEGFTATWAASVLAAPDLAEADRLYTEFQNALLAVLARVGNDPTWSRRVHQKMLDLGLDTDSTAHAVTWDGGSPGCLLPHAVAGLLHTELALAGMAETDLAAFRDLLIDPRLRALGNLPVSTIGRRVHADA